MVGSLPNKLADVRPISVRHSLVHIVIFSIVWRYTKEGRGGEGGEGGF